MLDEAGHRVRSVFAIRRTTFGEIAMAAFALCVISGVLLVPAFDTRSASTSIADWLLTNPGAVWLRNVHYWTAQVFLVGTVLHVWDHLRAATESRISRGVWLRLVLSIPVIAFLMLSGFLLRGDADAQQASRILQEIIRQLPLIGAGLNRFLFGTGEQLHVVYLHHAATATIVVALVIIEHVRRLWPRAVSTLIVGFSLGALSLVLSAGLHDGMDPRMKGPWYFLGLQEALHWTSSPMVVVALGVLGLGWLWLLPRLRARWSRRTKLAALAGFIAYGGLCGIGTFFRGEHWSWRWSHPDGPSDLRAGLILSPASSHDPALLAKKLPVVLGRAEGCLVCHSAVSGLGAAHNPESIGCASCHAGDIFTLDADRAHAGMIRIPGNLSDAPRTCGQAGCHSTIIPRVEQSIMTTFAGAIEVDRCVLGERSTSSTPPHVRDLGHSAADSHLRQLCASCHVGQPKEVWGPITQESRGGGCNACHLAYSAEAAQQLVAYESRPLTQRKEAPAIHPRLTIDAGPENCFGCHSRSGRISTNYEGWHELRDPPATSDLEADTKAAKPQFRQLEDGRYFTRVVPDVHHERGLECIDCHTANEVMGRGHTVTRKHEQLTVRCEDCHTREYAVSAAGTSDAETQKLWQIRQWALASEQQIAATASADPLANVTVGANGTARLRRKRTGAMSDLRAPLPVCTNSGGHRRLSCSSCHTAWAPRCVSCHTSFDPSAEAFDHLLQDHVVGAWEEKSGSFEAAPPTLGIRTEGKDLRHPDGMVETFVPGMILNLDRSRKAGDPSDPVFQRLYARTFAHTVRREARSCESCHVDPVALGYGRGELRYVQNGAIGRWTFRPEFEVSASDGLPADAWIGFLQTREGVVSTQSDVRPFTAAEQQRILTAGACMTCHPGNEAVMQQALIDFAGTLARRSARCAVPLW